MTCKECSYFWKEDNKDLPTCHFEKVTSYDLAPCEYDDFEDDVDESFYDPYMGCDYYE